MRSKIRFINHKKYFFNHYIFTSVLFLTFGFYFDNKINKITDSTINKLIKDPQFHDSFLLLLKELSQQKEFQNITLDITHKIIKDMYTNFWNTSNDENR
jgi:hypothetical protein